MFWVLDTRPKENKWLYASYELNSGGMEVQAGRTIGNFSSNIVAANISNGNDDLSNGAGSLGIALNSLIGDGTGSSDSTCDWDKLCPRRDTDELCESPVN